MPGIVEFPQLVQQAVEGFGDLFYGEPQRRHFAEYLTGLFIALCFFADHKAIADHPIGVNTYMGKWTNPRDPSKVWFVIDNVDGGITVKLAGISDVVSNVKLNTHSLSFLQTSPELDPLTGTPLSLTVNVIPDVRSNGNLFRVVFVEVESEGIHLINSMIRVENGSDQVNGKIEIPNGYSKRALENLISKQWGLRELVSCEEDVMFVQVVAMKDHCQVVFKHRGKTAQVPAKIVDNTVTISFDTNEYGDMKKIPLFKTGGKYQLQLIPLFGNKDQMIIKACSIKSDRTSCVYSMTFAK